MVYNLSQDLFAHAVDARKTQKNIETKLPDLVYNTAVSFIKKLVRQYKINSIAYSGGKNKFRYEKQYYDYKVEYQGLDENDNLAKFVMFFNI